MILKLMRGTLYRHGYWCHHQRIVERLWIQGWTADGRAKIWRGRRVGSCKWDRSPGCRTGCDAMGRRHHKAMGSMNHDLNSRASATDAVAWYFEVAQDELLGDGGLFTRELGSNDGYYSVAVMERWLAATRLAELEDAADPVVRLLFRRVFWGWALWSLLAVDTPRNRVTWIDPRGWFERGPEPYLGPGLRVANVGMRWDRKMILKHDYDHLTTFALDWRPRGSRFGHRRLARPWPVLDAAMSAWLVKPKQPLCTPGSLTFNRHVQAAALGFHPDRHLANQRRDLLKRVARQELPAVRELAALAHAQALTPTYRIYRHGEPTAAGASLRIIATERGKEAIWTGPIVTGNPEIQVAYRSISNSGHDRIATPMIKPRGGWRIRVEPHVVEMEPALPEAGGLVQVPRLGGEKRWEVEVSPDGIRML
jgi:hypothetical protein